MHCPPHARSVRPALELGGIRVDFPRALERLELAPEPAVLRGAIDRVVPGEMINMSTPYHRAELPGNAAQRQPATCVRSFSRSNVQLKSVILRCSAQRAEPRRTTA